MADERPWYYRDSTVILAVLGLLVIALPLVWLSPYYSLRRKIIVSLITLVGTYYTWQGTVSMLKMMEPYMELLK